MKFFWLTDIKGLLHVVRANTITRFEQIDGITFKVVASTEGRTHTMKLPGGPDEMFAMAQMVQRATAPVAA